MGRQPAIPGPDTVDGEPMGCAECGEVFQGSTWFDDLVAHWKLKHFETLQEMLTL